MKQNSLDEKQIAMRLCDPAQKREAFELVVRQYSPKIYWQIRRLVFSHEDANDIMQNTFIKAWTNLSSFRGESKLSTWLFRIAINESLTFLQRKRDNISLDDPEAAAASQIADSEYFDGDEAQEKFQAAIATLPDKQRLVFNMKYFDEMKYEEMSSILGTSVGALKASYHIAVEKITAILKND